MVQGWNMTEVNNLTPIYHGCKNLVLYTNNEAYFYIRFTTIYATIFSQQIFKGLENCDQVLVLVWFFFWKMF